MEDVGAIVVHEDRLVPVGPVWSFAWWDGVELPSQNGHGINSDHLVNNGRAWEGFRSDGCFLGPDILPEVDSLQHPPAWFSPFFGLPHHSMTHRLHGCFILEDNPPVLVYLALEDTSFWHLLGKTDKSFTDFPTFWFPMFFPMFFTISPGFSMVFLWFFGFSHGFPAGCPGCGVPSGRALHRSTHLAGAPRRGPGRDPLWRWGGGAAATGAPWNCECIHVYYFMYIYFPPVT